MKYNYRYIARIVIEAETPIAIGSGNKELTLVRPVAKDANGLPFIPGTSLAGVLRHAIYANAESNIQQLNDILGYQDEDEQENSLGSRLALSSAHLIGKKGKVFDGLFLTPDNVDDVNYELISQFRELPVRQHVSISHKGSADTENKGKFDEEVLYKGSRFIFEIELKGTDKTSNVDEAKWNQILNIFSHPDFRIGSGSTKGFGQIKVISINHRILNLGDKDGRLIYLTHSSCLDSEFDSQPYEIEKSQPSKYALYSLNLTPEDFYLFSSGLKSDIANMNPVMEQVLNWDDPDNPTFIDEMVLVPATSVKGAISHRLAYNYIVLDNENKPENEKVFADRLPEGKTIKDFVGENNTAVKDLFGEASDFSKGKDGQKGVVLFSDIYRKIENDNYKKLDHVAIDRFTGGAIDGALFNENVVRDSISEKNEFILEFWVKPEFMITHKTGEKGLEEKDLILKAFETTLIDICTGSLPLGGGTMRGNGVFNGTLKLVKNGKEETLYPKR